MPKKRYKLEQVHPGYPTIYLQEADAEALEEPTIKWMIELVAESPNDYINVDGPWDLTLIAVTAIHEFNIYGDDGEWTFPEDPFEWAHEAEERWRKNPYIVGKPAEEQP